MTAEPTCPACGEPKHPHLCKPALATKLAESIHDHAHDEVLIASLRAEVAELRDELHLLQIEVHQL